jgi:hypothetical protein
MSAESEHKRQHAPKQRRGELLMLHRARDKLLDAIISVKTDGTSESRRTPVMHGSEKLNNLGNLPNRPEMQSQSSQSRDKFSMILQVVGSQ